jgi:hypothetical protein
MEYKKKQLEIGLEHKQNLYGNVSRLQNEKEENRGKCFKQDLYSQKWKKCFVILIPLSSFISL